MSPIGWGTPGAEASARYVKEDNPFYDKNCLHLDDTDWQTNNPNHMYNWADYGSETLSELGWYLVTLATEYALLGQQGKLAEQTKTLEDIFLALQAIRRLDMQTQCLLKEMYDLRKASGGYVCIAPYTNSSFDPVPWDLEPHRNFDTNVKTDCDFQPNFSGYNGFFIREDAVIGLSDILNDPMEDQYNVGSVGSVFASSTNENNFECFPVDRFCYMAHTQNFISQDQLYNLLYGLAFIKRYIPASAVVVTCDGGTSNVLSIAQNITRGIVPRINDNSDHITIPGSEDCCNKTIKLTDAEGGNCRFGMAGLVRVHDYITGETTKITAAQRLALELGSKKKEGQAFYVELVGMGYDLSVQTNNFKVFALAKNFGKEIYLLGNDLLYPSGTNVVDQHDLKGYFLELLCSAPCGGPCTRESNYGTGWPFEDPNPWPEFECSNTPNWLGHRWDSDGRDVIGGGEGDLRPRQFNGLDFMALYNMYALANSTFEPAPADNNDYYVPNAITGPSTFCLLGQSGNYSINHGNNLTTYSNINWTSSSNFLVNPIHSTPTLGTLIGYNNNTFIGVQFDEENNILQYYHGINRKIPTGLADPRFKYETVKDKCTLLEYKKSINTSTEVGDYTAEFLFNHCQPAYEFHAKGADIPNGTFEWKLNIYYIDNASGNSASTTMILQGKDVLINNLPGRSGFIVITLTVSAPCGSKSFTFTKEYSCSTQGKDLILAPNPARDLVYVTISNDYQVPSQGINVRLTRTDLGVTQATRRIYQNGDTIQVSDLSSGTYNVQVTLSDASVLNATLVIQQNP